MDCSRRLSPPRGADVDVDPVLILLPDDSVRLYHELGLEVQDILEDFPGHMLFQHSRGSHRPPLPPRRPLRPGGTYFLFPQEQRPAPSPRPTDGRCRPPNPAGLELHLLPARTARSLPTSPGTPHLPLLPAACSLGLTPSPGPCPHCLSDPSPLPPPCLGDRDLRLRSRSAPEGALTWEGSPVGCDMRTTTISPSSGLRDCVPCCLPPHALPHAEPCMRKAARATALSPALPLCPFCLPVLPTAISASWQPCPQHSAITCSSGCELWRQGLPSWSHALSPDYCCSFGDSEPAPSPSQRPPEDPSGDSAPRRARAAGTNPKVNCILDELRTLEEVDELSCISPTCAKACLKPCTLALSSPTTSGSTPHDLHHFAGTGNGLRTQMKESKGLGKFLRTLGRGKQWKAHGKVVAVGCLANDKEQETWNSLPERFTAA